MKNLASQISFERRLWPSLHLAELKRPAQRTLPLRSRRRNMRSFFRDLLGLVTFVACVCLASTASSQGKPDFVRQVGSIEIDHDDIASPVGLAYSAKAGEFLVIESPRGRARQAQALKRLSDADGITGAVALPVSIADPINMVFDDLNARLIFLHPGSGKLMVIGAGENGVPSPNALKEIDIDHFGVSDPQGLAIDPITGELFILDAALPEIVRVRPDPVRGFEWPEIWAIDLREHGLDAFALRGLALDPTSGNLHVFSPYENRLYEVKPTGVITANRDLSGLDLRDPQGMVFAPSRDQTDEPSEMSLYIADSGAVAHAPSESATGGITEISLTETAAGVTRLGGDSR